VEGNRTGKRPLKKSHERALPVFASAGLTTKKRRYQPRVANPTRNATFQPYSASLSEVTRRRKMWIRTSNCRLYDFSHPPHGRVALFTKAIDGLLLSQANLFLIFHGVRLDIQAIPSKGRKNPISMQKLYPEGNFCAGFF
jgi:hypothetical protein